MKAALTIGAAALALSATLVMAQGAPESLLPPGFDDPAPAPTPTPRAAPAPTPAQGAGQSTATPSAPAGAVIQPLPAAGDEADFGPIEIPDGLPSLEELERMDPDQLDQLLGLRPKYDIPPAARRSMERVGVLASAEGGLPPASLANQPGAIVRAALKGTKGPLVSRWGHIMLRRALASRLETPQGMDPAEFAALRASLLDRMGEFQVARALVQDVDTANWSPALIDAALAAYVGTGDITGSCPVVRLQGGARKDPEWMMLQSICASYAGEGARASSELDRALARQSAPEIDLLLAQRYAGAAGTGRRAVNIEWDGVDKITPWRFALASALGIALPDGLDGANADYYAQASATMPELPLGQRIEAARLAGRQGILSSAAMVDLYGQAYGLDGIADDIGTATTKLRDAYVSPDPAERISAIRAIWGDLDNTPYDRLVLTAYAAARIPASADYADDAAPLIASMLSAGLDRDALAWGEIVPEGSEAWAMLVVAQPNRSAAIDGGAIDSFVSDDESEGQRKSAFLVAGLAGLGRIGNGDLGRLGARLDLQLTRETRWSRLIDRAAAVDNRALVAFLAGVGMQGSDWKQMTPRHLYHIVAALNRVGMGAEARMIAAEAVARG
ncbi:MAG: hypothetical protein IE933_10730 [Sphingomonadales bacterium]|nr:hypothetical protein [Sphingomonadales bacterium]